MADTPLVSALKAHQALGRAAFHTPGHRGRFLPMNLLSLDLTELPDTDSLFDAAGPILEAEQAAAKLFGAQRTLFSAGGCTLCIQTMLRLACPRGGAVLCGRVVHRSAVNAMALLGLEPVWARTEDLLALLEAPGHLDACYVTSPDYYGRLLDIPALAAACKQRGIPLLVDNAHGSHLAFTSPDLHPLHLGASMTADSAHKTLGVLTGGAMLQIGDRRFAAQAKSAMALFGSTSPSYPIMASLDLCRAYLEEHPNCFAPVQEAVAGLKEQARALRLRTIGDDPCRFTLDAGARGYTGEEAAEFLRGRGVEPEMADGRYCVLIGTPWNTPEEYEKAGKALAAFAALPAREPFFGGTELPPIPPAVLPLREAVFSENRTVPLEEAEGCVCAEAACPCPPGVPAAMPGELLTTEAVEFLRGYGFFTIKVL